jgi:hypothetical protein
MVTDKVDSAVQYTKTRGIQTLASLNLIEGADISAPAVPDLSTIDPATVGQNISVPDLSGNLVPSESSASSIIFIIIRSLWSIIAVVMAVLVANDLIFMPWQIRLLGFCLVFFNLNINPFVFFGVTSYYIIRALKNVYFNYTLSSRKGITPQQILAEQKFMLPAIYAFLPLVTWKEGSSGIDLFLEYLLFPIKYTALGESAVDNKTSKNYYYKRDKAAFEAYLKKLVPGFDTLLENPLFNIQELMATYTKYSNNLNYVAPLIAAVSKGASVVTETKAPEPTTNSANAASVDTKAPEPTPSANTQTAANSELPPLPLPPPPARNANSKQSRNEQNAAKGNVAQTTSSAKNAEQAWRDNPASGFRFQ